MNHPLWSEDRREFVPACDLRNGELLRTSAGTFTTVVGTVWRPGLHDVCNLQVDSEHIYHVGTTGVLVHNSCNTTVIGRMDDLVRFDNMDGFDTWRKSGRIPKPGEPPIRIPENRLWLQERIDRGDTFAIATRPSHTSIS